MTQKGVYPYEYMDSFERFQEPRLPPKDSFYSSLTKEDISKIDYTHAQRVFNHFDMTDHRGFYNFYLLLTYSRILETYASNIMVFIMPIITLPLVCPGKLLLKWQTWN